MVDALFADPRLAPFYDTFEDTRTDLAVYLGIVHELGAQTLLDVGCGTGTFAVLASAVGVKVLGIDPAGASLEIAKTKAGGDRVTWHRGDATTAPNVRVDLAVMTGNVAQVFISDDEWLDTLHAIRSRLDRRGQLVYETRRPEARAWEQWAKPFEASFTFDEVGLVRQSRELLEVDLPLVSFRHTYDFSDGRTIESETTLRFREDSESQELLRQAGFRVTDVRDAPDRPGLEYVYFASPS